MADASDVAFAAVGEEFYRSLLDNLSDGVYLVNRQRRITYWNRGAERLTGYSAAEVVGRECSAGVLCHVDEDGHLLCPAESCPAEEVMRQGKTLERRVFLQHRDGHRLPVFTRIAPLRNSAGEVSGALEIFSDDSAAVAAAEQIRRLEEASLLDPLTGVGNRRFAGLELANQLARLQRYGWPFGVIFMDIDHFKAINDTHGHTTGDAVLSMVARTMSAAVRSFDAVCRWGGEEFLVVLSNLAARDLVTRAEQIRRLVEQSALVRPAVVKITVSAGATMAREDDTPESLVERADALMYAAKRAGRNRVVSDQPGL